MPELRLLRLSLLLLGLPKAATHQDIGLFDGARESLDFGNATRAAVWVGAYAAATLHSRDGFH